MKSETRVAQACVGILLIGLWLPLQPAMASDGPPVRVPEAVVRRLATSTVLPVYPESSKNRGTKGVAVAQVYVNEKGLLTNVEILEAPDSEIEEAVIKAVKRWKFNSVQVDGKAMAFAGKLTFYFVINDGQASVQNPRRFK